MCRSDLFPVSSVVSAEEGQSEERDVRRNEGGDEEWECINFHWKLKCTGVYDDNTTPYRPYSLFTDL